MDKENLIQECEKDKSIGLVFDTLEKDLFVYKTRLLEAYETGFYFLLEDPTVFNSPIKKISGKKFKAGEYVFLTKQKWGRMTQWTMTDDLDALYHPICGLRIVLGDTAILERKLFIRKKWL